MNILFRTQHQIYGHIAINNRIELTPSSRCQIITVLGRWYFPKGNRKYKLQFQEFSFSLPIVTSFSNQLNTFYMSLSTVYISYNIYINNNCGLWQIRDILQLQIAVPSKSCRRILRRLVCLNCGIVTTCGGFLLLKFVELEKCTVHTTQNINTVTVTLKY